MYIYFMSPKISTFATLLKMLVAWFRCCSTRHSCLYRVPLSAVLLRLQPAVAFGSVLPSGIAVKYGTYGTRYGCVCVCTYTCTHMYLSISKGERKRERERESERRACMCIYIYMAFLYYIPSCSILLKYIKLQYYIWVVFVCIYVCMYVCVRVCVCVCAYADVVRVACMTHKDRSSKAQKP